MRTTTSLVAGSVMLSLTVLAMKAIPAFATDETTAFCDGVLQPQGICCNCFLEASEFVCQTTTGVGSYTCADGSPCPPNKKCNKTTEP